MQQQQCRDGLLVASALAIAATSLQGCNLEIPRHTVANWRAEPSYLSQYEFTPPGHREQPRLNSCETPGVPIALQCSGHGRCVDWFDELPAGVDASAHRLTFCKCDQDWADPECTTERKSQVTAFLLSLFFGYLGVDQFYLGFVWPFGVLKLITLGGLGVWWIYDVVRIGSSPVLSANRFNVAGDVAHWAFVLTVICFMAFLGFAISLWSINHHRLQKARDLILLRSEMPKGASQPQPFQDSVRPFGPAPGPQAPLRGGGHTGFSGYGTTLAGGTVDASRRLAPLTRDRVHRGVGV